MKKLLLKLIFKAFSDFYRFMAALLDWQGHLRVLSGQPRFDVACVTNFENELQQNFMGFCSEHRSIRNGMRFYMGKLRGIYILINSSAWDLERSQARELAINQARGAVSAAIRKGAKAILFAASTKRLFSEEELAGMRHDDPDVIFTIGDNGTAWALLSDVFNAIKSENIGKDANILVLGPNGFLGGTVMETLTSAGFRNLIPVSYKDCYNDPAAIDKFRNVELIVACNHHKLLRLKSEQIRQIAGPKGVYIVDVCKPANLSEEEYEKCKDICQRQDSGIIQNTRLRYVFALGAWPILKNLNLGLDRLFGCFSETLALGLNYEDESLRKINFLKVNKEAMAVVEKFFVKEGFGIAPLTNFGKPIKGRVEESKKIAYGVKKQESFATMLGE